MIAFVLCASAAFAQPDAVRLEYAQPAPVVDLGVGLWATPMPMDWDRDGDLDLLVNCTDKPYNGVWYFENPGGSSFPVFKPGVKLSAALPDGQVSYVNGEARVLSREREYLNFRDNAFGETARLCDARLLAMPEGRTRAKDWKLVDFDGDGAADLVAGIGIWEEYGWDEGYDADGNWLKGPLRGYVYLMRNAGTNAAPEFQPSQQLFTSDGNPIDTYGKPVPNLADFDGDGDLDLLCGEFVDTFNYYENTGSRARPVYAPPRKLTYQGVRITMDLCMIVPVAIDWDSDGDIDLIVGDEDGRVAWLEHTGVVTDGVPQFLPPRYFQQEGGPVKFGALVTPFAYDWDTDGDEDLIAGNTAGHIAFLENLDGAVPPSLAPPRLFQVEGFPFRIMAGPNGSIQGPAERKWGYTVLTIADWDHDGHADLIVNTIWGKVLWLRNPGNAASLELDSPRPVKVAWPADPPKPAWTWWQPEKDELVTQWRTTPFAIDWNQDGLTDLVMLDHEGYLAFFERFREADGSLLLRPGARIFTGEDGQPLRLNDKPNGKSGRRKLALHDWNGDGKTDLLLNSVSANFWQNVSDDPVGAPRFVDRGPVTPSKLEGHTTNPTVVNWNRDDKPELLIGAEDGHFYYVP